MLMKGPEPAQATFIQYFQTRNFENSLQKAMLAGGNAKRFALKVKAILGSLDQEDPFVRIVKQTNHGENRIPHCVKYDLGDGWRLVTCQYAKTCGFLFVGKHDDADRWLETNKGQVFAVEDRRATLVPGVGPRVYARTHSTVHQDKKLIDYLPAELGDLLFEGLPRSVAKRFESLDGRSSSEDLLLIAEGIDEPEKAKFVIAVFNQLLAGNVEGAENIVKLRSGAIPSFDDIDDEQLLQIEDGPEIRRLRIGSDEYEKWLNDLEKRMAWYEWFLYLHPEQEKVVKADYPGSVQLSGVSGSGKTCVAVRRALRLAEQPDARVLLVTLNRSLAGLLRQLVEAAGTDEQIRSRIEVTSFFELAQSQLIAFEPDNKRLYRDVTWRLSEHVDEIFREYYRQWLNFSAAGILVPTHLSMNARGVNGEVYLREEFDWIRAAVAPEGRKAYLDLQRRGRRFQIASERRQDVLTGLSGWETKMREVGVIDYLGLTSALSRHLERIESEYTNIIVDEAQDFGTTELRIIRHLVAEGPNDIFLCGDIAQTILPKHRALADAGIHNLSRARIVQNYRNSREILMAAYEVLRNNLHEDILDSEDLEILDPKFANFSGSVPMALCAESLEEEIAYARSYAETRLSQGVRTICIAFAGFSSRDIAVFAKRCGVMALDGNYDPRSDSLVFCDLEQTKGYEFETLIIIQCTDAVLPPRDAPKEEEHRAACKLYVAMTRARRDLILSFHGTASPWIMAVNESIGTALWSEAEDLKQAYIKGVPEVLPEVEPDSGIRDAYKLSGIQFLYTSHALGLSIEAQQKLIEIVDGRGLVRGGSRRRVKWADVGSLLRDLAQSKLHDTTLGPAVAAELRQLAG